eukprot:TRINITY_DN22440_c0_g1_i1.p1 TRINITY_DN22440_c0_g1~~TRINITY_DN22440_c0_g1_i1.p1  ORF type:complete len:297 (-),score=95.31 TRINITY_DN22440_c0_g1_i1:314-1204(-)
MCIRDRKMSEAQQLLKNQEQGKTTYEGTGNNNPAGVVSPSVGDWDMEQALALYKRAHEQRRSDYTELINKCIKTAEEQRQASNNELAVIFEQHADETRKVRDYGREDFMVWYTEDVRQFKEFDVDVSGFLDPEEFRGFVKAKFKMTDGDADKLFEEWDVDKGKSIGPYEFVSMMAVYHSEQHFAETRIKNDCVYAAVDGMLAGGVCGAATALYFGLICSLCTLCLSWIPFYCVAKTTGERLGDPEFQRNYQNDLEKACAESVNEARKHTIKRLLKGPNEKLITRDQCATDTNTASV